MSGNLKRCFKCQCEKPTEEFYKHSRMSDGRLNKCKECTRADVAKHRLDNLERIQAYDKSRGSSRNRRVLVPHEKREQIRREGRTSWETSHPQRAKAQKILSSAVANKKVVPWPVCAMAECNRKPQAHHPDYSRPLDVVWLCPSHHTQAHRSI